MKISIFAVTALQFALSSPIQAAITDIVDTPDRLSFNISGTGLGLDFRGFTYWHWEYQGARTDSEGNYGYKVTFRHMLSGPPVTMGMDIPPSVAFGTELSDTQIVMREPDTYIGNLSITVQNDGNNRWGDYFGAISIVHVVPEPSAFAIGVLIMMLYVVLRWKRKNLDRKIGHDSRTMEVQ